MFANIQWKRVAWALAAQDICTDVDHSDPEWLDWAESQYGNLARQWLAAYNAVSEESRPSSGPEHEDVTAALRAAESGISAHWPTVGKTLANEVRRLREVVRQAQAR